MNGKGLGRPHRHSFVMGNLFKPSNGTASQKAAKLCSIEQITRVQSGLERTGQQRMQHQIRGHLIGLA